MTGPVLSTHFPSPTTQIAILAVLLTSGLFIAYLRSNSSPRYATAPTVSLLLPLVAISSVIVLCFHGMLGGWLGYTILLLAVVVNLAAACWLFAAAFVRQPSYPRRPRINSVTYSFTKLTAGFCMLHLMFVHAERAMLGLNQFFENCAYVMYLVTIALLAILIVLLVICVIALLGRKIFRRRRRRP